MLRAPCWRSLGAATLQALRALTLLGVLAYLALALIFALPDTPLRVQLWPLAQPVVGRFFSQRWGMFAPNPRLDTRVLFVRCLGEAQRSEWMDVTSALARGAREQPFSARLRLVSYLLGVAVEEPQLSEARRADLAVQRARVGSVACADAFPALAFTHVELKVRVRPPRSWASRAQPPAAFAEQLLGTFPRVPTSVRPGLFRGELLR